jgi:Na+/H+-dicarboxylate symporter
MKSASGHATAIATRGESPADCRVADQKQGSSAAMKPNRMTTYILVAMLLGIAVGAVIHAQYDDPATRKLFSTYVSLGSLVFLRLIKMIIGPLVFSTLVVGIGHMSDTGTVGRVGGKAMLWFVSASLVSLTLGLVLVNLFQPGAGVHKVVSGVASGIDAHAMTLDGFIKHVFPDSAVRPMVDNEILQIVVFSIFFGVACASMGKKATLVLEGIEGLSHIILRVTGYVMKLAPLAVFCAMTATIATNGLGILASYAKFMGEFYFGLVCMWILLILVGYLILGSSVARLVSLVREPFLLAFSTASSEAAYPKMLEQLAKFPITRKISSFVLPLGYSFNLDGTMMYCTFASVFIAQAYDIPLSTGTQVAMLLTLMLTSKGVAGVPRASLVVIAATLSQFSLPEEGLLLILGIDTFLDMGRSATNVIGNSLATAVVAKWEGQLISDEDTEAMIEEMEVEIA